MASKEVEMKPVGFGELDGEMDIEAGNKPQVFDRSQRFNRADVDSIGDPFLCLGVSTRDYVIGSVCYIFLWGGTLLFYYLMMQLLTVYQNGENSQAVLMLFGTLFLVGAILMGMLINTETVLRKEAREKQDADDLVAAEKSIRSQ